MKATISADIVKSTSFDKNGMLFLQQYLQDFFPMLHEILPSAWGRVVRGDELEIVLPEVKMAMRIATVLKCYVKSFTVFGGNELSSKPDGDFLRYGVRIAVGIGALRVNDKGAGIIDGDAIYASGRALDQMTDRSRSIFVFTGDIPRRRPFVPVVFGLVDELLTQATARQCEVLFWRLRGLSESAIAIKLKITQVAVHTHLRRVGWHAINDAITTFEEVFG